MKKEIFIAIFVGLVIGLIITFGMYRARTAVLETPQPTFEVISTPPVETLMQATPEENPALQIQEPEDETLSNISDIRVSGSSDPNIPLLILYNEKELVTRTDAQGNFSVPISLQSGGNIIRVRAMIVGKEPVELTRSVVYSANEFLDVPGATTSAIQQNTSVAKETSL